jgi:ribosomal protein S8
MRKYRNVKTACNSGHKHDSKKEAVRCNVLSLQQKAGLISDLKQQPTFLIAVNGHKVCKYRADFGYVEKGAQVIEDVKGIKTPTYRLKAKLLKACHGITILET